MMKAGQGVVLLFTPTASLFAPFRNRREQVRPSTGVHCQRLSGLRGTFGAKSPCGSLASLILTQGQVVCSSKN